MAAGKPIVASNIEGYSSVVTHGQEGLLVPPKNEEALEIALETLLEDPALREEMGSRGRQTAHRYDWKGVTDQIMDYYQFLLERRATVPLPLSSLKKQEESALP